MMATSNVNSCLESINAPSVSDFGSTDYTDVNESYFEQAHDELETQPITSSNGKGSTATRRSRESIYKRNRRASVKAKLSKDVETLGSLPDISSPSQKRRKYLNEITNRSAKNRSVGETPTVLMRGLAQRELAKLKVKTTETLEEERIAADKERRRLLLEQTKEGYEKLKKRKPKIIERGVAPTIVQEFHFATDARIKQVHKEDDDVKNFVETLRNSDKEDFKIPKNGRTEVKPFKLTESKKRPHGEAFKSLAEGVQEFSNSSHRTCEKDLSEIQGVYHLRASTIAKTPKFSKRVRHARKVESFKDLEEKELEECRKNQFKANPLKENILKNKAPLKEVEKRPTTKVEPFNITDESNKKEKVLPKKNEPVKQEARKGATSVVPFSFDQKDKLRYKKKQETIKQEWEKEKKLRDFQAHPMPIFDEPHGIPEVKPLKPTKVEPFKLHEPVKTRQHSVEEEKKNFRARPATVLQKTPFIPKTGEIPPVVPDKAFVLHTDQRSEEREQFLLEKKEREAELMALNKQREEEKRKEEEEMIKQRRADAVHRAQPVHRYKPVEVQHGLIPVTHPVSPNFSDRFSK